MRICGAVSATEEPALGAQITLVWADTKGHSRAAAAVLADGSSADEILGPFGVELKRLSALSPTTKPTVLQKDPTIRQEELGDGIRGQVGRVKLADLSSLSDFTIVAWRNIEGP